MCCCQYCSYQSLQQNDNGFLSYIDTYFHLLYVSLGKSIFSYKDIQVILKEINDCYRKRNKSVILLYLNNLNNVFYECKFCKVRVIHIFAYCRYNDYTLFYCFDCLRNKVFSDFREVV